MPIKSQRRRGAFYLMPVLLCAAALVHAGTPVLVMADGPESAEKSTSDTAFITGTEWSESPIVENGLTLHVMFKDPAGTGFRDSTAGADRRARLYEALRYVAEVLNADGELNVMIGASESDGSGPLAQGGPLFSSEDGLTNGSVFQRISTGTVPFPGYAEMALTFDWGYAWHTGTGAPPANKLDLRSVAVHEITHCLGFMSLIGADGVSRLSGLDVYAVFDSLLAKKPSLALLLGGTTSSPVFAGSAADLIGNAVVFAGSSARTTFGSAPPVYSSSPYLSGTSLQHWVQGSIPGGAVMEPSYSYGVARREYADVEIATLRDIGWSNADTAGREPCPVKKVAILQPAASGIAADASNKAVVHFRASVELDMSDPLCSIGTGAVEVEYFVDGTSGGVSYDEDGNFPIDLTLNAGNHTIRAVASRTDSTAGPVEARRDFTISAYTPTEPKLSVTPTEATKDFGTVNAGGSAEAVYTVKIAGTGTLSGSASLSGASEFQFVGASTYSLPAGAQSTVTVRFSPGTKGDYAATLNFGGNGGAVAVALAGEGVKNGGLLNCYGANSCPEGGLGDMLVCLLAMAALMAPRMRAFFSLSD